MKRLLITGASGFLGGHVFTQALQKWQVFAGYGNNPVNIDGGKWVKIDLADEQSLVSTLSNVRPRVVVHSAAISNLDVCEKDPQTAYQVNAASVATLARLSAVLDFRLIFVSTDMVFDGSRSMYCETDTVSPISVYGKTKVAAETSLLVNPVNSVIVRSALIYGRAVTGGSSFSMWLESKLRNGDKVALFGDQYRTPILVNNLARAILELADNNLTGIYHLGGTDRIDRFTFGQKLCEIGGYPRDLISANSMYDYQFTAPRPIDVSLDTTKTRQVFNTPVLGIDEGLREMFGA